MLLHEEWQKAIESVTYGPTKCPRVLKEMYKQMYRKKQSYEKAERKRSLKKEIIKQGGKARDVLTTQQLRSKLETVIQLFIRLYHTDSNGYCNCYTCGKALNWSQIEAGHCFPRRHKALVLDLNNMRPQCFNCNKEFEGRHDVFVQRLEVELGSSKVNWMRSLAKPGVYCRRTRPELEHIYDVYMREINNYKSKKNFTFNIPR